MNWNVFITTICAMSIFFNVKYFSDDSEHTSALIYNIIIFLIIAIVSVINNTLQGGV